MRQGCEQAILRGGGVVQVCQDVSIDPARHQDHVSRQLNQPTASPEPSDRCGGGLVSHWLHASRVHYPFANRPGSSHSGCGIGWTHSTLSIIKVEESGIFIEGVHRSKLSRISIIHSYHTKRNSSLRLYYWKYGLVHGCRWQLTVDERIKWIECREEKLYYLVYSHQRNIISCTLTVVYVYEAMEPTPQLL